MNIAVAVLAVTPERRGDIVKRMFEDITRGVINGLPFAVPLLAVAAMVAICAYAPVNIAVAVLAVALGVAALANVHRGTQAAQARLTADRFARMVRDRDRRLSEVCEAVHCAHLAAVRGGVTLGSSLPMRDLSNRVHAIAYGEAADNDQEADDDERDPADVARTAGGYRGSDCAR